jgi:hypothetical protein
MRLLFPGIVFLLTAFHFPGNDVIVWKADRPLTWKDFQGKPEKRWSAASTHYNMYKTTEDKTSYGIVTVEAIFYVKESWKRESWINESVLAHEQKHFDIVELFSRKLRKAIREGTYADYEDLKRKTDALYEKLDKEMDVYQDKYDDETDASMNGEKQHEWNTKIMQEISGLKAYAATELKVNYKP